MNYIHVFSKFYPKRSLIYGEKKYFEVEGGYRIYRHNIKSEKIVSWRKKPFPCAYR